MEGRGRENQCLTPIQDKRSRRVTYARRNRGLKKKIQELATLCDVEACFISLGSEGQVETWPAEESKVHETIRRYRSHPKANREKNMVVGTSTSAQEAEELGEVQVLLDGNSWTSDEQEISNCHHEPPLLDELSNIELAKLDEFLGIKMKKIQDSIDAIIKSNSNHKNERRNIGSIRNYTANRQVQQQQQRLPFFYINNKIDQQKSHVFPVTGKPMLHNFLA